LGEGDRLDGADFLENVDRHAGIFGCLFEPEGRGPSLGEMRHGIPPLRLDIPMPMHHGRPTPKSSKIALCQHALSALALRQFRECLQISTEKNPLSP
jgi:hypothetical protein